jgi:uncharacterized membrane protein
MRRPLLRSLPAFVIAVLAVYTYSVYATLPAQIATHWGANGQPNGWSSREFGAWFLPGMMVVLWIFFRVLPEVDTRKASYDKFGLAYELATTCVLTFMAVIQYVMLSVAQGRAVDINTVVYFGIGSLFVILGAAIYWRQR